MRKITSVPAIREDNPPGLCQIRFVKADEVAQVFAPEKFSFASDESDLTLKADGLVLKPGAQVIDVWQANMAAVHNEALVLTPHGERWQQKIALSLSHDTKERGKVARVLSRGRWVAIVTNGFDTTRLVGLPAQPLKLASALMDSNNINWTMLLTTETSTPAYYFEVFDLAQIVGNKPFNVGFNFGYNS